ncbi:unnamed protein product [Rotaria socialis]|uniref:GTP-binding protein n=2 Tax=Rotaria socialis TaxID=392032 RepID=A0A820I0X7_9BILA|nr:unnamed protein product [Rotaria socialis]CAF3325672.1 unnamed protein product [Rotaria socialis]CAF3465880.1 unnamed protein product [Rotaria socialis]CAF3486169.1 unnamed protein product [Rotaria socialis]CAF3549745.1 unnamed protein product [Rotaria socialis]
MLDPTSTITDTGGGQGQTSNKNINPFIRPRILLTGLRRSGKTSIQRVIFTKMQPSQTQFLESTSHLTLNQFSCGSFINFQVQELPGQLQIYPGPNSGNGGNNVQASSYDDDSMTSIIGGSYDLERLLKRCNAVVYIIDAQDDYSESITRLNTIIQKGRRINPRIRYEIFIHKVDQLSEETKIETQRDIHNQVRDRFADPIGGMESWSPASPMPNSSSQDVLINFHLTSIYDHSIFEAFSKVIQKLIPEFAHLERLLNYLLSTSNIEQAFLFDVQTKISIATDSSPTDMQMYELCCDMIDLLINMSEIYGQPNEDGSQRVTDDDDDDEDEDYFNDGSDHNQGHEWNIVTQNDEYDENNIPLNSSRKSSFVNSPLDTTPIINHAQSTLLETTSEPASAVFDSMSSSVIKLTGGRALYLKEINRHLALICILREEALTKQALIDYNVRQLKKSIIKLFRLNYQASRPNAPSSHLVE